MKRARRSAAFSQRKVPRFFPASRDLWVVSPGMSELHQALGEGSLRDEGGMVVKEGCYGQSLVYQISI